MDRKCESITPFRIPILAIKGAICHGCLEPTNQLNKCAGCKRASYCSKSCQKQQWNSHHKRFCLRIRSCGINDVEKISSNFSRTWRNHRDDTVNRTEYIDALDSFTDNILQLRSIMNFRALFPDYRIDDQRVIMYSYTVRLVFCFILISIDTSPTVEVATEHLSSFHQTRV